jgi:hypothetical protein
LIKVEDSLNQYQKMQTKKSCIKEKNTACILINLEKILQMPNIDLMLQQEKYRKKNVKHIRQNIQNNVFTSMTPKSNNGQTNKIREHQLKKGTDITADISIAEEFNRDEEPIHKEMEKRELQKNEQIVALTKSIFMQNKGSLCIDFEERLRSISTAPTQGIVDKKIKGYGIKKSSCCLHTLERFDDDSHKHARENIVPVMVYRREEGTKITRNQTIDKGKKVRYYSRDKTPNNCGRFAKKPCTSTSRPQNAPSKKSAEDLKHKISFVYAKNSNILKNIPTASPRAHTISEKANSANRPKQFNVVKAFKPPYTIEPKETEDVKIPAHISVKEPTRESIGLPSPSGR